MRVGERSTDTGQLTEQCPVIYVLGCYRSGTTLLSNLLGQAPGACCVGELSALWRQASAAGSRCGCGRLIHDCELWSPVLESVSGDSDASWFAQTAYDWQSRVIGANHRWARVPHLLRANRWRGYSPVEGMYTDCVEATYRAIAEVSGAEVIIDASKEAGEAALLRQMPGIDSWFVHIVRDPRGVVYSHYRSGQYGERQLWRSAYFTMSWILGNLAATAVRRRVGSGRSLLVRYEDLVSDPEQVVQQVFAMLGREAPLRIGQDGRIRLEATHSVDGNPSRFSTGDVGVREDRGWRAGLPRRDQFVIEALGLPLLRAYDYERALSP